LFNVGRKQSTSIESAIDNRIKNALKKTEFRLPTANKERILFNRNEKGAIFTRRE
jgi:hypothetical protein